TPAYMAPEQRQGEADIDHRADVYAWGLLAHEMLTGRLPAAAVDGVPRRSSRGSSVPVLRRPLADVVARCLSTDPDDRPQRMAEVLHALRSLSTPVPATREPSLLVRRPRRTMLGVGAGIILLGTLLFRPDQPREAGPPSLAAGIAAPLAVAPLTNQTGDPALDSWGRMAADWITQGLQEVAVAPVVPWTSALGAITRADEGGGADVVRLLRSETGAGAVVSGSYYLVGDSLSVRVELTDANTGRVLSAPPPVVVPRDSTAAATRLLRDRVMAVVAIVADGRISQVPGVEGHPPSFEAYRAFDDGMRRFLDQDYADAEPFFRDAHDRDSSFAIALLYAATAAWNQ